MVKQPVPSLLLWFHSHCHLAESPLFNSCEGWMLYELGRLGRKVKKCSPDRCESCFESLFLLFLQVAILPLAFIEYLTPADEHYFGSAAYWMKEWGLILGVLPNHRIGGRMPALWKVSKLLAVTVKWMLQFSVVPVTLNHILMGK